MIINDPLVKTVERAALLFCKFAVAGKRLEQPGGEQGTDPLEVFEKDEARRIALPTRR